MTDQERLNRIKKDKTYVGHKDCGLLAVDENDFEWLIERVEHWKKCAENENKIAGRSQNKVSNLENENKRYKQALGLIHSDTFYEGDDVSVRHMIRKRVDSALKGESEE